MIYIYGLFCPVAKTVRYVGKSNNPHKRLAGHICGAQRGDYNHHTARWLRKLVADGLKPSMVILHKVSEGERWQDIERSLIASAAERGWDLTNSTAGGEGLDFLDPEDDRLYREKLSRSHKAIWATPEKRAEAFRRSRAIADDADLLARRNASIKAAYQREETKQRISMAATEINSRPEVKAAKSRAAKANWADPDYRLKIARTLDASGKAKQSERKRAAWADPEVGAKLRAIHSSDEVRRKKSEGAKRRATPEYRAMMAERTRAAWARRKGI